MFICYDHITLSFTGFAIYDYIKNWWIVMPNIEQPQNDADAIFLWALGAALLMDW